MKTKFYLALFSLLLLFGCSDDTLESGTTPPSDDGDYLKMDGKNFTTETHPKTYGLSARCVSDLSKSAITDPPITQ